MNFIHMIKILYIIQFLPLLILMKKHKINYGMMNYMDGKMKKHLVNGLEHKLMEEIIIYNYIFNLPIHK